MDFSELSRLASGHVEARIVQAAVQLGVFDALENGPLEPLHIASALHTEARATELLLNSLVAMQLLEKKQNTFSLTPASRTYLVTDRPQSLTGMIRFDASLWHCWEQLAEAVRSGKPARAPDMYQDDPRETETFINAMDSLVRARRDSEIVATALDWRGVAKLLDIGSGPATYPIALCRKYPQLRATIFELPATLDVTRRYVGAAGMEERISLLEGDYRTDLIPGHYDLIFLSNIIHGESYDENQRLMAKLYANLSPGGRLVVKDHVLDTTRTQPAVGALFSLLMLLTTQSGRCYGFDEIKAWLEKAGFHQVTQIDLPPPLTSALVIGEKTFVA
ncbi:MAG: methyltransferase [Alphaproteobacteria bacterium]